MNLDAAIELHMRGDLDGAERGYRLVISHNPSNDVAHGNLGLICLMTGRAQECMEFLQSALKLNPNNVEANLNLGVAYEKQERWEKSIACYEKALELNPECAQAHTNLGLVFHSQGELEHALTSHRRALELNPQHPEGYFNLGHTLQELGLLDEAISCYHKALELKADYPEAYINLGVSLNDRGRVEDAIVCLTKAIELKSDCAEVYNNLGTALLGLRKWDGAAAAIRQAIELSAGCQVAYGNLGIALLAQGKLDEAMVFHHQSLEIKTANLETTSRVRELGSLLIELLRIPIIYKSAEEIEQCRQHYTSCLEQALFLVSNQKTSFSIEERNILREIVFGINNFHLAYQQLNDKELQMDYCRLATKILEPEINSYLALNKSGNCGSKIRLGIASELLKNHNGSFWAYGWLSNLPAQDYEFFLYSLSGSTDELTRKFAQLGTYRWLPFRQDNYLRSLEVIREDNLDVLLLPDVGMASSSRIISLLRLAPIQCVGWGHPVTTGSQNIDYYLSSELMETEQADNHYSEKLIRLPHIGLYLDPPMSTDDSNQSAFGIPKNKVVYGALQSLFKYLPQFDLVFPAIAKRVPDAFFVFAANESQDVTAVFEERLRISFEQSGLIFENYVQIMPRMTVSKFMELLGVIDVYLDSIGWNGGITTLRSLTMNLPVVTLPGEFMRGRHSCAMLEMIGLEELIAGSLDDYIEVACKIGLDNKLRASLAKKIEARKHKLFNDLDCVEYLDKFFKSAVDKSRQQTRSRPSVNLDAAIELHLRGDLDGAEGGYRGVISADPNSDLAHGNLALICMSNGRTNECIELLHVALQLNPSNPDHHVNLGIALLRQGDLQAAVLSHGQALKLNPSHPQAYCNLGLALCALGRLDDAVSCQQRAIEFKPDYPEAYCNLGVAFQELNRLDDAVCAYRQAIQLKSDYAQAYNNLGAVLLQQGKLDDAVIACRKAIELRPDHAEAYNSLGQAFAARNRLDDAIGAYQRALEVRSAHLESSSLVPRLGYLLHELKRLPVLYRDREEIKNSRDYYRTCLNEALDLVSMQKSNFNAEERAILGEILFGINNFYLPYQQDCDRELQILYSRLVTNILKPEIEAYLGADQDPRPDSRIRLGIASEYLKYHNGSFWAYGWLSNLPRHDYEFFVYSLNGKTDEYTRKFAELGTYRWLPFRQRNYRQSLEIIKGDRLDVLLLPDVGMTASSKIISLLRLAPVQCVGWGHPVTTGSPNIDYYLSSELMETEASDSHYSEELIRLPHTGMHFNRPEVPAEVLTASDFGIPEGKIIYGAVQSLFKYLPQYDFVYPAIAKDVADAWFVFIASRSQDVTAAFEERLKKSFERSGLVYENYVQILPRMEASRFLQLLGVLDIYLDSIGWNGANTTLHSLAMNCPVVTLPGQFMRGRHSCAMLELIGVKELIASSLEDYISLACKIGLDSTLRSSLVEKIQARQHKLFNDTDCVAYLDKFFKSEVGKFRQRVTSRQSYNLDAAIELHRAGDLDGAERAYRLVISENPSSDVAHGNLGAICMNTGRTNEGIELLQLAVQLNPSNPDPRVNLGVALFNQGKLEAAASSYRQALDLKPGYFEAHNNLGNVLSAQGDFESAVLSYRQALELKPDYADAHYNLGNVLRALGKLEDAVPCYRKALELRPDYAEAYQNLGLTLAEQNELDDAISAHHKTLETMSANLESNSLVPKLGALLVEMERIPIIYGYAAEISESRDHYIACLRQASLLVSNPKVEFSAQERSILRQVLFRITSFQLAYQQLDDKDLQVAFCRLATKILNPEIRNYLALNSAPRSDSRIRVGIASEVLKHHSGAYWAYGWLANLPPEDYQFFLYSLNGETDAITGRFAQLGTYRWLPFRQYNYLKSLEVIKDDHLDVLLLPDVGMSASSRMISLHRLAPVQCVGWGHPVTTGSPNIDYYLSSELMETEASDSHYSEKLIRLPNIGIHIDCPVAPAEVLTRSDFRIPEGKVVYGAVQSLFKYLPQFDFVYPAIAKEVPDALFVFVSSESQGVTAAFEERLKRCFEQSGLAFENYVQILPRMKLPRFMQLLGVLDVYLDSIGWNGGTTTLRSLAMNCPVVTLPGEFMRGRHSYAMLKMISAEELIANGLDGYISLAGRIGLDSKLRLSLVEKIKTRKHKLFNDTDCVAYLDTFFKAEVGKSRRQDITR